MRKISCTSRSETETAVRDLGGPGIVVFGDSFINKSTRPRQQGNRDLS